MKAGRERGKSLALLKGGISFSDDKKLTDDEITNFVTSLLPITFHILFNNYEEERKTIFNILSTLRPGELGLIL